MSELVEIRELCRRAGIRYGVIGGFPPLLVLRDGGGHASGKTDARKLVYVDTSGMPRTEPERSIAALEALAYDIGSYEAGETLAQPIVGRAIELRNGSYEPSGDRIVR